MRFKITENNQLIDLDPGSIDVAESSSYLTATFDFSSAWDGFTKLITFVDNSTGVVLQETLSNDAITEAMELVLTEGDWTIKIVGTLGDKTLHTIPIVKHADAPILIEDLPADVADGLYAKLMVVTKNYATRALMLADTSLLSGMIVQTLGYYASGDGGGAMYTISSTGTANNVDVIALSNGKFAKLVYNTYSIIDSRVFGIFGTDANTVDSAVKITAVMTALNNKIDAIYFEFGEYFIGSRLTLKNIRIIGNSHYRPTFTILNTFTGFSTDDDIITYVGTNANTQEFVNIRDIKISVAIEADSAFSTFASDCSMIKIKYCNDVTFENVEMTGTNAGYSAELDLLDIRDCNNKKIKNSIFTLTTGNLTGGCLWIRSHTTTAIKNILIENCEFIQDGNDETIAMWSTTAGFSTLENVVIKDCKSRFYSSTQSKALMFNIENFSLVKDVLIDNFPFTNEYIITQAAFRFNNYKHKNIRMRNVVTYSAAGTTLNEFVRFTHIAGSVTTEAIAKDSDLTLDDCSVFCDGTASGCAIDIKGGNVTWNGGIIRGNFAYGIENFISLGLTAIRESFFSANHIKAYGDTLKFCNNPVGNSYSTYNNCKLYMQPNLYIGTNGVVFDLDVVGCYIEIPSWCALLQEGSITTATLKLRYIDNYIKGSCTATYGTIAVNPVDAVFLRNTLPERAKASFSTFTASGISIKGSNIFSDSLPVTE